MENCDPKPTLNSIKPIRQLVFGPALLSQNAKKLNYTQQANVMFLKYFPKYLNQAKSFPSNNKLDNRIRRIKIIQNLSSDKNGSPRYNFWRLSVANKRKNLQKLSISQNWHINQKCTKGRLQLLKMLPATKSLHLYLQKPDDDEGRLTFEELSQQIHYMERVCCYLPSLRGLKHLKISVYDEAMISVLSRLNFYEEVLSRLETFEIVFSWENSHDYARLKALLNYKVVLKHVKHLNLSFLAQKECFQTLQALPTYCHNLSSLAFSTSQKDFDTSSQGPYEFDEEILLEDYSYLKCLQEFKCLQKLLIDSCHQLDFLRECVFPASLQHLQLQFSQMNWQEIKLESPKIFHEQPQTLKNLKTLEITFSDVSKEHTIEEESSRKYLIEGLLKDIPALAELKLVLTPYYFVPKLSKNSVLPFDLPHLLNCIKHCKDSLHTLHIEDTVQKFLIKDLNCLDSIDFPQMSKLFIQGEIPNCIELEKALEAVKVDSSRSCVTIDGIRISSCEMLLNFLNRVGRIKGVGEKHLELGVYLQNLKEDFDYFEKNHERVREETECAKNVVLKIRAGASRRGKFKFMKELEWFKPLFKDVSVAICYGWIE